MAKGVDVYNDFFYSALEFHKKKWVHITSSSESIVRMKIPCSSMSPPVFSQPSPLYFLYTSPVHQNETELNALDFSTGLL